MKRAADWVRAEILASHAYAVPASDGLVKLDAMENPYRLPPELAAQLGERLSQVAINRYPEPANARLKEALRESMGLPPQMPVVLGNGSDEVIQLLSLLVARPGAVALALEPSFVMYKVCAMLAGLQYAGVSLRADFSLDEETLQAAIERHRPAITWLAYPNNPTGNLFPREAILRAVAASPGLVVVDEAYFPFSGGATLRDELGRHPNLVLVRTVSKLGLAGLRLGLAAGPAEWMGELEKVRPPYNVNVLTAAAGEVVLAHRAVLEAQATRIVAERARLEAALDRLRVTRFPSAANFVLVRVGDAPRVHEALKARGILVKSLHGSHPLLANCLRLTVGSADENAKLLEALASILAAHHAKG